MRPNFITFYDIEVECRTCHHFEEEVGDYGVVYSSDCSANEKGDFEFMCAPGECSCAKWNPGRMADDMYAPLTFAPPECFQVNGPHHEMCGYLCHYFSECRPLVLADLTRLDIVQ